MPDRLAEAEIFEEIAGTGFGHRAADSFVASLYMLEKPLSWRHFAQSCTKAAALFVIALRAVGAWLTGMPGAALPSPPAPFSNPRVFSARQRGVSWRPTSSFFFPATASAQK